MQYIRLICPISTVFFCLLIGWTSLYPWLSDASLDLLFKLRGVQETSQAIVIVGVDEKSLDELGRWPFDRQLHAKLIEKLSQAKGIGFDFLFDKATEQDHVLRKAIVDGPPIALAAAQNYEGELLVPVESLGSNSLIGHIETNLNRAGCLKSVFLRLRGEVPVLSLAVIGEEAISGKIDLVGEQLINFYGPEFTFLYISYSDVLSGEVRPDFFKDRYVLVGIQALGLGDVHITPFSRKHPIPGVEVQATILNNLLDESFVQELQAVSFLLIIAILFVIVFVCPDAKESHNLLTLVVCVALICIISVTSFGFGFFVNPSLPLFFLFTAYTFHFIIQGFWVTRQLINEVNLLGIKLNEGRKSIYKSVPSIFGSTADISNKAFLTGGIRKHIGVMQDGIKALTLQRYFVNYLLNEETPPLVLWERRTGKVIVANSRFSLLWEQIFDVGNRLPELEKFSELIVEKQMTTGNNKLLSCNDILKLDDLTVDIVLVAEGRRCYFRVLIHTVVNQETGFEGILASFTDVTEIKELERLKGEVMNIVSHELKLPLTTIIGYGEMLSAGLKSEKKRYADEICAQSNRLSGMIEAFLDIARIENGKYAINKYPIDFLNVVYDAESAIAHFAETKGITLRIQVPSKISPVLGDEQLLTQVVLNLLDNAIKFSPLDSQVDFSLVETETTLRITVADEGSGIPEEERKLIFEKFSRGGQQPEEKGVGLGLSFVQQVVKGHGGEVVVDESESGGAEFSVILKK